MNHLDLFSGIGGFALGLERAGFKTVAFCEISESPQKVLKKHWHDVPIYEDVRSVTAERLRADGIGRISVLTGGFPCQPHSRANSKRQGFNDERDLSGEMLRIMDEFKPDAVVGENTEGIIDTGLASLCDEMEKIGYFALSISVPACAYGLPTMERHVWIIATRDRKRSQRIIEKTIQNIESLQGEFQGSDTRIPDRWGVPEARVYRVCERIPRGMDRIKSLGNAVDPIMPELIGRAILEIENNQSIKEEVNVTPRPPKRR